MLSRRILTSKDRHSLAARAQSDELNLSPRAAAAAQEEKPLERYMAALTKLIPPEVVAAFLTIDGIVRGSQGSITGTAYWIIFLVMLALCMAYVLLVARDKQLPPPWRQAVLATAGFVVWAHAIGGPFAYAPMFEYNAALGGIIAILFTLIAPFVADPEIARK